MSDSEGADDEQEESGEDDEREQQQRTQADGCFKAKAMLKSAKKAPADGSDMSEGESGEDDRAETSDEKDQALQTTEQSPSGDDEDVDDEEDEGDERKSEPGAEHDGERKVDSAPRKTDTASVASTANRSNKADTTAADAEAEEDAGDDEDDDEEQEQSGEQAARGKRGTENAGSKYAAKTSSSKEGGRAARQRGSKAKAATESLTRGKRSVNASAKQANQRDRKAETVLAEQSGEEETEEAGETEEKTEERLEMDEGEDDEEDEGERQEDHKRVEINERATGQLKATKSQPKRPLNAFKSNRASNAASKDASAAGVGKKRVKAPPAEKEETKGKVAKRRASELTALEAGTDGDAELAARMDLEAQTGRSRRTRKRVDYNENNSLPEIKAVLSQNRATHHTIPARGHSTTDRPAGLHSALIAWLWLVCW